MPRGRPSKTWSARAKNKLALWDRAETLYKELRGEHDSVLETLQTIAEMTEGDMVAAFVSDGGPWQGLDQKATRGAFMKRLSTWAADWEVNWRRNHREIREQDDVDVQIMHLRQLERDMKALLDGAIEAQRIEPGTGNAQTYQIAYNKYTDVLDRLNKKVEDVNKDADDRLGVKKMKAAVEYAYKGLYKDYKGTGQVYRILCKRAAVALVTVEQLESEGKGFGNPVHAKANQDFLMLVAQIQKYTESTKVEIHEEKLHEFGDQIMRVIERYVGNQPILMRRIIADIEGANWNGDVIDGTKLLEAASAE